MDGASGLLVIALIAAGFTGVLIAGGEPNEGYRFAPEEIKGEPTELSKYDRIVGNALWAIAFALIVVNFAVLFEIFLPAPGYEWLEKPLLWALPILFAGNFIARADEPLGTRDLLYRRLWALGLCVVALAAFYLST